MYIREWDVVCTLMLESERGEARCEESELEEWTISCGSNLC